MVKRESDRELDRVWLRHEKAVKAARNRRDAECWKVEKPIMQKVDALDKVLDKALKEIERESNRRIDKVEKQIRLRQDLLQRDEEKRTKAYWKTFDETLARLNSEREKKLKKAEKVYGPDAVDRAHERHVKRTWGGSSHRGGKRRGAFTYVAGR